MHTVHRTTGPARRGAFAVVLAAAATVGIAPAVGTATRPGLTARGGTAAAGWVGRQFLATGDLRGSPGQPGIDDLPLAVVALASARVGSVQIAHGITYLEHRFQPYVRASASGATSVDDPGRLAELILAAVAARANPERFGGTGPSNNLVARLLATQTSSGLFGSPGSPTYSTAYTQGLALTALAAVGQRNPRGAAWLVAQQCRDGGWEAYRSSSAACPAPNPKAFAGPDTNDTALAVEGLVATKVSPRLSPLPFLRSSQYRSGGFGYYGGRSSSQSPDPDSTAVVAQALAALGKLAAVTRHGKGAEAGLAAFHLGCGAAPSTRGAYWYPPAPRGGAAKAPANLYATIQAVPAALREPYPVEPGRPLASLPRLACK